MILLKYVNYDFENDLFNILLTRLPVNDHLQTQPVCKGALFL